MKNQIIVALNFIYAVVNARELFHICLLPPIDQLALENWMEKVSSKGKIISKTAECYVRVRPRFSVVRKSVISPDKYQITLQFLINLTLSDYISDSS